MLPTLPYINFSHKYVYTIIAHCGTVGFWLAKSYKYPISLLYKLSKNPIPLILSVTNLLILVAACRVSCVVRYRSMLYCPISRHFSMREKSSGMVTSR